MAFENITLTGYIASPDDFAYYPSLTPAAISSIKKMLSPFYAPISLKMRKMREIRDAMVADGVTDHFEIKLIKALKPVAYMRDGEDVYFSLGLLAMKSPLATLPVCLHELSHVILSRLDGYTDLKALQREFRASYGDDPDCELMSPIEFYADLIAFFILVKAYEASETKKEKKRLSRVIAHRNEKLLAARAALERIKQKNI